MRPSEFAKQLGLQLVQLLLERLATLRNSPETRAESISPWSI